jgi:hypothetical protein
MRARTSGRRRSRTRPRFTRRAKAFALGAVVVTGAAVGYFALFPGRAPAFVRDAFSSVGLAEPPKCPLTGVDAPRGAVPERPTLAIKVENSPESRPQASLNDADIVVEEPVEGGYTRFIAIFHCGRSERVGPVRSGRMTDPAYLRQFREVVFGYAGGVSAVKTAVERAGLVDVNYIVAADAYTRDASRSAPHDLFTTTAALWRAADKTGDAPSPVFAYSDAWDGKARRARTVHLPYSGVSDVYWAWSRRDDTWLRSHGTTPHTLEDGSQVAATNVVIQIVEVTDSRIIDAAGNASPDVELTGAGRAYVLRDGRMIAGRWERESLGDVTRFLTRDGAEITLAPGRTWVQLVPSTVSVERVPATDT